MQTDPKVAVLLDEEVISSGEAMAISFIDRPNSRSFGLASCGLSTVNKSYSLPNGATLVLTVATIASREETLFGGPIIPDEEVNPNEVVSRAIEYLRE
jgi:carboxyl-terminal processing protease